MVSVFGAVILFSLIALAMVLKKMRNENMVLRGIVLGEERNFVQAIEEKLSSLEGRAGSLEARAIEAEAGAADTPPEGVARVPVQTLRSLIRLLGQHGAESSEIDVLMQQLPEGERNALSEELKAAESGSGHAGHQQPEEDSLPAVVPDSATNSDSEPTEAHGSEPIPEGEVSVELLEEEPIPPEFVEYKVQVGDTLSAIALLHRAPVAAILELNQIDDPNQIRVGSVLRIPSSRKAPQG
tara:strand:+ start:15590 stop:16309 length:720 start_codon:yes stop_codon:yes gene_type:complete